MNKPPEKFIRVKEDDLVEFAENAFKKSGLDEEHAALFGRLLVNADLRGVRSHGSRNVNGYCSAFETRQANPRPNIQVVQETPAIAVLDGDGTLGYLPMVKAAELAVAKAKAVGLGMVTVRPIGHYGSAGHATWLCRFLSTGIYRTGKCARRRGKTANWLLWQSPDLFCYSSQ